MHHAASLIRGAPTIEATLEAGNDITLTITDCDYDILDAVIITIAGSSLVPTNREKNVREEAETFWNRARLGKIDHDLANQVLVLRLGKVFRLRFSCFS